MVLLKKVKVKSGLGEGRPLVLRLDEVESELRLISSRVDNSVRLDDKVKLEKELLGLRNSVADFSARFSGEMEFSSKRLKKDIEEVTKNLEREIVDLSKGARNDLNSRQSEVEDSLRKLNEEVQGVSREVALEMKDLSKDVDSRTNVRFGEIDGSLARMRGEMSSVFVKVGKEMGELSDKVKGNSNVELSKRVGKLEGELDEVVRIEDRVRLERELSRVKENVSGVFVKLSEEISEKSRRLKFEVEDLSKRVKEDLKEVVEDSSKASVASREDSEESLKSFFGKVKGDLKGVEEKAAMDLRNFSKEVERNIRGLVKEVERNSLLDVHKRVGVLEKGQDDFVRTRDGDKLARGIDKVRGDLEDVGLRTRDELKFVLKKETDRAKEVEKVLEREIRGLDKRLDANSTVELNRSVTVLEKELDAISGAMSVEDDEVNGLKRVFEDRLFVLEKRFEKLDVLVARNSVQKEKEVDIREVKALEGKIKDVDLRISDFEGRVDLETDKIYGRLSESLELMMFWEKKLAGLSKTSGDRLPVTGSRVLEKRKVRRTGVIRGRGKVLERLRRSHVRGIKGKVKKKK